MNLIPDSELITILIKDNDDILVDIKAECPNVVINPAEYLITEGKEAISSASRVRKEVARRLNIADSFLPNNFKLSVKCGFRPLYIQKLLWEKEILKVKTANPNWTDQQIKEEASRGIAPLEIVPPHSTGGAIDLTIIDESGNELDMGTPIGQYSKISHSDCTDLPSEVLDNRNLLADIMTKAGFVNYPTEWWHWTYGDRYWAAFSKKPFSIYKGL